jgi:sterol desaturase/sphingolipid hydroxylase (fatty acid hydroxylase superfamily)
VLLATNLLVHKLFGWAAKDRNYAAHFAFLDHAFGTAHRAERPWPDRYGVVGDYVPNGFLKQLAFPFRWKGS